jgi:hypothetical protein
MIESVRENEKVSPEAKRLEERNLFCINMADHMKFLIHWTEVDLPIDPGCKLGQFSQSDHGGGNGPPWKGRATPLVAAGKAGARIGELGLDQEDDMLKGLMRFWEQDELRKIKEEQEHERSLGSSHVDVGGGAA